MTKEVLRQVAKQYPAAIMQPYDTIYESCGFDAIYAIAEYFGGMTVYVPSGKKIFSKCIEQDVKQYLTDMNIDIMAAKYGYSKRHIRRLAGH